jgi:general secretion pathway protein C
MGMKRLPLVASFLLFIALCASIAYWALQLFKPPLRPVAAPPRTAQAEVHPQAATALFGARGGPVAVASNYQLRGVIFSGTPRDSVAILSTDGKPAQAVSVNMELIPGVTVKEVHREYVLLSEGGAIKRVELPESAKEQGGVVSGAGVSQRQAPATAPVRPPVQTIAPAVPAPPQVPPPPAPAAAQTAGVPPASTQPSQPATTSPRAAAAASPTPPALSVPPATMTAPPTVVTNPPAGAQYAPPPTAITPPPAAVPQQQPAPSTSVIPSTLPSDPATAPLQSR